MGPRLIASLDEPGRPGDVEADLNLARSIMSMSANLPSEMARSVKRLNRALAKRHIPPEFRSSSELNGLAEKIRSRPRDGALLSELSRMPFLLQADQLDALLALSRQAFSEPLSSHELMAAQFSVDAGHRLTVSYRQVGSEKESSWQSHPILAEFMGKTFVSVVGILEALTPADPVKLDKVFRANPPSLRSLDDIGWRFEQRVAFMEGLALRKTPAQDLSAAVETLSEEVIGVNVLLQGTPKSFETDKRKLDTILSALAQSKRSMAVHVFVGRSKADSQAFKTKYGDVPKSPSMPIDFKAIPPRALDRQGNLSLDQFVRGSLDKLRGNVFFIGLPGIARFELSSPDGQENALREGVLSSLTIAFIDDTLHVRALAGADLFHILVRALRASA